MTREKDKSLRNGLIITAFGIMLSVFVGFLFQVNDRLTNLEKTQAIIHSDIQGMRELMRERAERSNSAFLR